MKSRYRLFKRGWGVFYAFDNQTGNSESLKTANKNDATRLVHAKNEAVLMTRMNAQIARAYLSSSDPEIVKRSWQTVVDEMMKIKAKANAPATVNRWKSARRGPANSIGNWNGHYVFLRRIRNFAVGMGLVALAYRAKETLASIQIPA